jgi:hypothetical protein
LLAILQSLLVWQQISIGAHLRFVVEAMGTTVPSSANGLEENGGRVILGLGITAVVLAAAWLARVKVAAIPEYAVLAGVLMVVVAGANWILRNDDVSDFNGQLETLSAIVDTSGTSYSVGIGIYVALAGGLITTAGGLLGLMGKRRHPV